MHSSILTHDKTHYFIRSQHGGWSQEGHQLWMVSFGSRSPKQSLSNGCTDHDSVFDVQRLRDLGQCWTFQMPQKQIILCRQRNSRTMPRNQGKGYCAVRDQKREWGPRLQASSEAGPWPSALRPPPRVSAFRLFFLSWKCSSLEAADKIMSWRHQVPSGFCSLA